MTDTEKLSMLTSMTGETDTDVLSTYLTLAKPKIILWSIWERAKGMSGISPDFM